MAGFFEDLNGKIDEKKSALCVGISPDWDKIPETISSNEKFKSSGAVLFMFNKAIIDAICDIVPAISVNFAKYMRYGIGGMISLKTTVDYAKKKGLAVICDLEGTGNLKYVAEGFLKSPTEDLPEQLRDGAFDTDAVSVDIYGLCGPNTYDEIFNPLFDNADLNKGVFVVYNEGAIGNAELIKNIKCYSQTREKYSKIGVYVKDGDARSVRKIKAELKNCFIISENPNDAIDIFDDEGHGGIIVANTSVMYAYKIEKWANKYGINGFADAARSQAYAIIEKIG